MRVTKTQIRRIIKEELNKVLAEQIGVSGAEMADALSADFPEGAFQSGMDEVFGPQTYIDEFVQRHPDLAEKFGSLELFQQLKKSHSNLNKAAVAMPRDERRRKFASSMDLVDWVVDDMAKHFSRKRPTPKTHADISALGLEDVPSESRSMFMPGGALHTFLNTPGNEGMTPPQALELYNQAFKAFTRIDRAERNRMMKQHRAVLNQGGPGEETEMMQWITSKMQELV